MTKRLVPNGPQNRPTPRWVYFLVLILLLADVVVALILGKLTWFPYSKDTWTYLTDLADDFSVWTGRAFWVLVILLYAILPVFRQRTTIKIPEVSQFVQELLARIPITLRNLSVSIPLLGASLIVLAGLNWATYHVSRPPAPPASGRIVVPTDPRSTLLYVLAGDKVVAYDRRKSEPDGRMTPFQTIPLSDSSRPEAIAITYDADKIFVADSGRGVRVILNPQDPKKREETFLQNVTSATSLALTGDGRKLYLGTVGPIPEGGIRVFDTGTLKEIAKPIRKIGCPVGLFAAPNAPRLFIATQCGGGRDPLYVVDTLTDYVIRKLPGFAVGSSVVATPDGEKVFVSTGDTLYTVENYMAGQPRISAKGMPVTTLTMKPDGTMVVFATEIETAQGKRSGFARLNPIDSGWNVCLGPIPAMGSPISIAFAPEHDGSIFTLLDTGGFFVTDSGALECESKSKP